jgi:catechol 2,3-dioxygenase-like lactoylglutathione lyase family enzyme
VTDGLIAPLGPMTGVRFVTARAERLCAFYADAFGFTAVPPRDEAPAAAGRLLGLPGAEARSLRMRLGRQEIEFVSIVPPGQPYPRDVGAADTIFQHIALVVADMDAAVTRLSATGGSTPISTDGPQALPASSGGVIAYKFRDPEGHPLEFLKFPDGRTPEFWAAAGGFPCLGFDHSAIVVADTEASLAFYRRLGLERRSYSLNTGAEQARLDGVRGAVVEVTGLTSVGGPPHIELLCYRNGTTRTSTAANDVAATQIAFAVADADTLSRLVEALAGHLVSPGVIELGNGVRAALLRDPDGHRLLLRAASP